MQTPCSVLGVVLASTGLLFGANVALSQPHKQSQAVHTLDLTVVKPETVGFSSERLERLHALIQNEIDQKKLAGAVTILARHGKVVEYRVYGQRDLATSAPMARDTIFRV